MLTLSTIFVLLAFMESAELTNCPGVYNYFRKSERSQNRFTTIYDGNYTVQALLTFSVGESDKCNYVDKNGLLRVYAIKYAIDKVNVLFRKYGKIGLQLDDVCRSLPITMARGIEVVSLHRPNSVCRADFLCEDTEKNDFKQAVAIIGTLMSFTSIPLASLMSLYDIPQISHTASSRLLSKKDLYKSFFRTIPSDKMQVTAMLDILKKFGWTYIIAIGSDDNYGKLGISDLKREAQEQNICIAIDEYIASDSATTSERIVEVVEKLKEKDKAQAVVLFCYVSNLGDKILQEAERQGVRKIWLTSEAWNPAATDIDVSLRNQTEGVLTVSIKSNNLDYLLKYIEKELMEDCACNIWLHNYLQKHFNCTDPLTMSPYNKSIICSNSVNVSVADLMSTLSSNMPASTHNLVDAVTALGHGILKILQKQCRNKTSCNVPKIEPRFLTDELFNVSFINELNNTVSFDSEGNPKTAVYTIENLQIDKKTGKHVYVPVGVWEQGKPLKFNDAEVKWPAWWRASTEFQKEQYPPSRCAKDCVPGEYRVGKVKDCCWKCTPCLDNQVSNGKNMEACKDCGNYYHTKDGITCILTPIRWMTLHDSAGMTIFIISIFSLVLMIVISAVLLKLRHLILPNDKAPHMTTLSCVLPVLTFIYGLLHIIEPTNKLCQARNAYFFMLLMMYASILVLRTKYMSNYLQSKANKYLKGSLFVAQMILLTLFLLLESASIVAWIFMDDVLMQEFRPSDVQEIWKQCEVSFTAPRLVSTFIACIMLIVATFTAYRERNLEHTFYEPKFLSFTCIALCIIIVAFLPTFKYVVGIYKAIVMAFTMDVFAFTFMACLVLPKVYMAIVRHRKGINQFPLKPASIKRSTRKGSGEQHSSKTVASNGHTNGDQIKELEH